MSILRGLGVTGIAAAAAVHQWMRCEEARRLRAQYSKGPPLHWMPPSREETIGRIEKTKYDMVIVGGGSVGAGCALDASTRGYSVLLLEREDFSSGTSSKSTKLIHGGIRYLEKAIKELDVRQLSLVVEGLRERKRFLEIAPYLTREVGILLPIRSTLMIPYFYLGTKLYDWMSGIYGIERSFYASKKQIKEWFPSLSLDKVAGGMIYFDGQMNDSRVNTMLVETAVYYGADALNHMEVTSLLKSQGKVSGVTVKDKETGKVRNVRCKGVINATGPFSDSLRQLDKRQQQPIIVPSKGTHLVIDSMYTGKYGLINPSARNGSVLFALPWNGVAIVGTTDTPLKSPNDPVGTKSDVRYILNEMSEFVSHSIKPKAANILSIWAGVRPLVSDPSSGVTGDIVRSHYIGRSDSGLVTVAGGKWTSYREMAESAVTASAKLFKLPARVCRTQYVRLIGSHKYIEQLPMELSREFSLPGDVAEHLARAYGDRAWKVCEYIAGPPERIHPMHPYITAEIPYAIAHEHARTVPDFLGRRTRLAFDDVRAARSVIASVSREFQKHLNWSRSKCKDEQERAARYADSMGYSLLASMEESEKNLAAFKLHALAACSKSLSCPSRQMIDLTRRFFGPSAAHSLQSVLHGRTQISLSEALRAVQKN